MIEQLRWVIARRQQILLCTYLLQPAESMDDKPQTKVMLNSLMSIIFEDSIYVRLLIHGNHFTTCERYNNNFYIKWILYKQPTYFVLIPSQHVRCKKRNEFIDWKSALNLVLYLLQHNAESSSFQILSFVSVTQNQLKDTINRPSTLFNSLKIL